MNEFMDTIKSKKFDIALISKANLGPIKPEFEVKFNDITSGYNIESKVLPNNEYSRVTSGAGPEVSTLVRICCQFFVVVTISVNCEVKEVETSKRLIPLSKF